MRDRRSALGLLARCVTYAIDKRDTLALIVVDVDAFAKVNGTFGYDVGDQVLRHVASRLQQVARKSDFVARIGDNRFALILRGVMNRGHAELAVHKITRLMHSPVQCGDSSFSVSLTVGGALCPAHASHPEQLMRRAEAALMRARQHGDRFHFARDSEVDLDLSDLWDLELQLSGAIERGEMVMYYQPQVRLSDMSPVGAEALMRWNSSSRGMVGPSTFIPVAERTGQIKRLTVWALNTALRQAGQWASAERPLSVSVNLPGTLAMQHDLPDLVEAALNLWHAEGLQLVLEITESSLMDTTHAFSVLKRVRALGVRVSIDDFGTGYSCLAYFRNLPVDELKVDRTFVSSLLTDNASSDITQLIVDLAHRFELQVAAEGIEDMDTMRELQRIGCDVGQGYLFGKPGPASTLQAWLDGREHMSPPL